MTIKFTNNFFLDSFSSKDGQDTVLYLPDRNIVKFNAKGSSCFLPAKYLKNIHSLADIVKKRVSTIKSYCEFVHNTLYSLKSVERKSEKKKMSKKDIEKLNLLKDEIFSKEMIIFQEKNELEKMEKSNSGVFDEVLDNNHDLAMNAVFFFKNEYDKIGLSGFHSFDLLSQSYKSVDFYGRQFSHKTRGFDEILSKIDYFGALQLTNVSTEKMNSATELRSNASSTKKCLSTSDFETFYNKNLNLITSPKMSLKILKSEKNSFFCEYLIEEYFNRSIEKLKQRSNFETFERNSQNELNIRDFIFSEEGFEEIQNALKVKIPASMDFDVCEFQEINEVKKQEKIYYRTIIHDKIEVDIETFKSSQNAYSNWQNSYQLIDAFFGNKNLMSRSNEDFEHQVKLRTKFYQSITNIPIIMTFKEVFDEILFYNPVEEENNIIEETLKPRSLSRKSYRKSSGFEKQVIIAKSSTIQSAKKSHKSRTMSKTSSFLQELFPKFVQNYFETLEGKQYLINNPKLNKPVIFTEEEKILINQLKAMGLNKDIDERTEKHKVKLFPSNTPSEKSKKDISFDLKVQNRKTINEMEKIQEEEEEKNDPMSKEKPKKKEMLKSKSIKKKREFLKKMLEDEEAKNLLYHEMKSSKYDVYGQNRRDLPQVHALYKQNSSECENDDYLLDPVYKKIKGKIATGQVECFVKPSVLHKFRNYAPHNYLFQSLDKGFKSQGPVIFDNAQKTFVCHDVAPNSNDLIVFPNQLDFGKVRENGCYELKFTIINLDWVIQRVSIKPPIQCDKLSVVYSQEPFAPGLRKSVFVQLDARSMTKGFFVHNIIVESKYRSYKVVCTGTIIGKTEQIQSSEKTEVTPVLMNFKDDPPQKPLQYKVKNLTKENKFTPKAIIEKPVKGKQGVKTQMSLNNATEGMTSENLPRLYYDSNFTVN